MIPWYKRFYQVREELRETELDRSQIMFKMSRHFDNDWDAFHFTGHARHPFAFEQLDKYRFKIRHTKKWRGGKDPSIPRDTLISGYIEELNGKNKVRLVSSIPITWAVAIVPSSLLASTIDISLAALSILFYLGVILWFRHMASEDVEEVDIEIYKALKTT